MAANIREAPCASVCGGVRCPPRDTVSPMCLYQMRYHNSRPHLR